MSADDRWDRIATGCLVTAGLFGVFTVHSIYSGDDVRGIVMTVAPGLLCLGLWRLAAARRDQVLYGDELGPIGRLVVGVLTLLGFAGIVLGIIGAGSRTSTPDAQPAPQIDFDGSKFETGTTTDSNGNTIPTLRRKTP